jgi:CDP-paratose 2-epimerase
MNERAVLITGGAGFVGVNVAKRYCAKGRKVIIYDNLSRAGVERNLRWLKLKYPTQVEFVMGDVRDKQQLAHVVQQADTIFHFAAQVAVTTSLDDPVNDFDVNVRGTLNVLEAARACAVPPAIFFTSTNKVYGAVDDLRVLREGNRYVPAVPAFMGINEQRPLDFHSPYGCSKGAADQYVLDYCRSYGIPTVVFRMSCIYGPHQFGTEDQGWVAHFLLRAMQREPVVLYGDGCQVRDVLFVEDLVDAFLFAHKHIDLTAGHAYNIGGGPANTVSLLELIHMIEDLTGHVLDTEFAEWRTGDQRCYISDTSKFTALTRWRPIVNVQEGVRRLHAWLQLSQRAAAAPRVNRRNRNANLSITA